MDDIQYRYTQKLREGILSSLAQLLGGRSGRKFFKQAKKAAKDDPELQSNLLSLAKSMEGARRAYKNLCKRNPDHPNCNQGKRRF